MEWISVIEKLPTIEDGDENGKVLIFRVPNINQKSLAKSIYDWNMVKYCDKNTYWMILPKSPL